MQFPTIHPSIDPIIYSVFAAANPEQCVQQEIEKFAMHGWLDAYRYVWLIGFGKAVLGMAKGACAVIGEKLHAGFLIAKHIDPGLAAELPKSIQIRAGNHPVPGELTYQSSKELLSFIKDVQQDDLVIALISGGGSALCSSPHEGIDHADMQTMTELLLACGAEIQEINVLRKHVDAVKGGGLARQIAPAKLMTFVLSDVIGSPLDVIASGPTVADASTYADMQAIIDRYQLSQRMPGSIIKRMTSGLAGQIADTPKKGDDCFANTLTKVVSSNAIACEAAVKEAQELGWNAILLTSYMRGEAREAGRFCAGLLTQMAITGNPLGRPACAMLGGETTVTLRGHGLGGRNQELALGAVKDLSGMKNVLLVALATDGEDGPTDAAGAWVDGGTYHRGLALGLNPDQYLANNDAYHYFEAINQLVMTGPSGTNVNDCCFLFAFSK